MNTKKNFLRREIVKRFALGNVSEKLSDSKLKALLGGYGTCAWKPSGPMSPNSLCNVSYSTVMDYYDAYGGNWCCDSCSTSSWYNQLCG